MSTIDNPNGEEAIDESGRNLTQQRLDEEGTEDVPVDAEWDQREAESGDGSPRTTSEEGP